MVSSAMEGSDLIVSSGSALLDQRAGMANTHVRLLMPSKRDAPRGAEGPAIVTAESLDRERTRSSQTTGCWRRFRRFVVMVVARMTSQVRWIAPRRMYNEQNEQQSRTGTS